MSISMANYCLVLPNRRRFLNLIPTQVFGQSSCHQKKRFMKSLSGLFIVIFIFFGCDKDRTTHTDCNIQQAYADNAKKVTITNGIWGTVSSMEENCMPVVPTTNSTCKYCPVKRTVKIYQYSLFSNATPSGNSTIFFDINTPLVAEVNTDDNGFFQLNIPA